MAVESTTPGQEVVGLRMLPTGRKKMVMKLLFLSLSAYMH
jgi:hypothetical protein